MPGIWLSEDATSETTPKLKVEINICVTFKYSFITCGCVPRTINKKHVHSNVQDIHITWMHLCIYYELCSNFMIILLCEILIRYHKSDSEIVTYLIELLNNFHILAKSRIFNCSFPLILCSPNVKPLAPNVAL